jgi:diguanylate cyclase (GGDEF)-like protein
MTGERILVVDDEESICSLLAGLFRRAGYEVVTAEDGAHAYHALGQSFFHVCIIDLHLPDMGGIEILRHVRQAYPESEVIILTGYGDLQTAVEALRLGAYDYLQKPVLDLQLILIAIGRALERQKLTRSNTQLVGDLQKANAELEARRRQQLQYINYIGRALSGALNYRDVIQVLVQAMLESISCDGAGALLLHQNSTNWAWAMTGAKKDLTPDARRELVAGMARRLPESLHLDASMVQMLDLPGLESKDSDDEAWRRFESRTLSVSDELEGIAIVASHVDVPFGEEALGFFEILVTQASTALANARLFVRANELATRDGLTGLYNHRHFFELLEAEISRAERHGQELAVVMLDIDRGTGLKRINDTLGHQAGDEALCTISHFLQENVRRADVVARYGGDEFIVLAPQTGQQEASVLANRICEQLAETPLVVQGQGMRVTVSVGVAVFRPGVGENASIVVSRADRGLYLAKEQGGNRVCYVASDEVPLNAG